MPGSVSATAADERAALLRRSHPAGHCGPGPEEEEGGVPAGRRARCRCCLLPAGKPASRLGGAPAALLAPGAARLLAALSIAAVLAVLLLIGRTRSQRFLPPLRAGRVYRPAGGAAGPGSRGWFEDGLRKCEEIRRPPPGQSRDSGPRVRNPRAEFGSHRPVLIRNAVVWDGDSGVLEDVDVLLRDGLVAEIRSSINPPENAEVVYAGGRVVTPGLVDMHSHVGVASWPFLEATEDTNEGTGAALPFLRSLDAFNQADPAIRIIASGGVTTSLVLPGSSNLMGGEAFAFKMRVPESNSAEDMLLNAGLVEEVDGETGWRWMKMACGENPKNAYGKRGIMPASRMGSAFIFKERLIKADALLRQQLDWCAAAESSDADEKSHVPFPEAFEYESLISLLRGVVKLNVHCYTPNDMEMMIRLTREIPGLEISAFHHALEAHLIIPVLKRLRNNVTIAIFADHWGYKHEAFDASVYFPKILHDAGVPVAVKSDHPVLNAQHLVYEAQKAHHYGMTAQAALSSVTTVPAKAMGVGHRIGKLAAGYDADVVIWDRHPLRLGAYPVQVFVDGISLIKGSSMKDRDQLPRDAALSKPPPSAAIFDHKMKASGPASCTERSRSFVVKNIGTLVTGEHDTPLSMATIVVEDGRITCAGRDCDVERRDSVLDVYNIDGGWVVPGTIAFSQSMGLVEIPSEKATSDGDRPSSTDPNKFTYAVDGLRLDNGKHLQAAFLGGVTAGVVAPQNARGFVSGWLTAYRTGSMTILDNPPGVIKDVVGLLVKLGDDAKDDLSSVSSQIAALRDLLEQSKNSSSNSRHMAALGRGEMPLVVHTHSADIISQLIVLKRIHPRVRIVVLGGAEAHIVARQLREVDIPVVLSPPRCTPGTWESRRCLHGPPLAERSGIDVLFEEGVDVGLAVEDDALARNLLWEAGWAQTDVRHRRLSDAEAIALVTSKLSAILGLDRPSASEHRHGRDPPPRRHDLLHHAPGTIRVGALADFVAFDSRPLEFGAAAQLIVGGGKRGVVCWPAQGGLTV